MYSFLNDYSEGAHERIIEALAATNREQTVGYGEDEYCERARGLIKNCMGEAGRDSDIHFLVGGTQTNMTFIASALRPHQGAVAADTGHINAHESGAVEATGHKVLAIPSGDGLLRAGEVKKLLEAHRDDPSREHTVQPGMVYISHPTELGTLYTKKMLAELFALCREWGIPLFVDGARLGCALAADGSDVTLGDLAALTDAFYIGGTKMGALFGEALVINSDVYKRDFRYHMKQRGGMLAKGRLLGIQFAELFSDGLYFELARHANGMARRLSESCGRAGCGFLVPTQSNQVFPVFERSIYGEISSRFRVSWWRDMPDGRVAARLCASWATRVEATEEFDRAMELAIRNNREYNLSK